MCKYDAVLTSISPRNCWFKSNQARRAKPRRYQGNFLSPCGEEFQMEVCYIQEPYLEFGLKKEILNLRMKTTMRKEEISYFLACFRDE